MDELTIPYSKETEEGALAQVFLNNSLVHEALAELKPEDFYIPRCQAVFCTFDKLVEDGSDISPVTVGRELGAALTNAGGYSWLTQLTYGQPSYNSLKTFVKLLKEDSGKRKLLKLSERLSACIVDGETSKTELITLVDTELDKLRESDSSTGFRPFADVAGDVSGKINDIREGRNPAISSGLLTLDKVMKGGGQPGELHIWAALTGGGKSVLMKQIAQNVASRNESVAILTAEMSDFEVFFRMLSPEAEVPAWKIQPGMASTMIDKLERSMLGIANLPIWIDDRTTNIYEIRARTKSLVRLVQNSEAVKKGEVGPVKVLLVDYLQLLEASSEMSYRQVMNRAQEMGVVSRLLKKLAKELGLWVIALAQFNRKANEKDEDGLTKPELHHLAESGSLEKDSDLVGIIDMDDYVIGQPIRNATLRVVKYRNGPPIPVKYKFNGDYLRFEELVVENKNKREVPELVF
jgi:replicative DNA helicase